MTSIRATEASAAGEASGDVAGVDSSAEAGGRPHPEGGEHGAHPSDRQYVVIALILAAITAVEVVLSYWNDAGLSAPLLLVGMALKFAIVAGYFMHLKFDSRLLRRLFLSGLGLALFCYIAVAAVFHAFTHETKISPQGPGPVVTAPAQLAP